MRIAFQSLVAAKEKKDKIQQEVVDEQHDLMHHVEFENRDQVLSTLPTSKLFFSQIKNALLGKGMKVGAVTDKFVKETADKVIELIAADWE